MLLSFWNLKFNFECEQSEIKVLLVPYLGELVPYKKVHCSMWGKM